MLSGERRGRRTANTRRLLRVQKDLTAFFAPMALVISIISVATIVVCRSRPAPVSGLRRVSRVFACLLEGVHARVHAHGAEVAADARMRAQLPVCGQAGRAARV